MNRKWFWIVGLVVCWACQVPEKPAPKRLISYVNPMIGTGGKGKTYPGATVPHGMVQLSPDNGRNGWDWISGYFYPDSVIAGFSHLHLSGTGAGDLYDISYMPVSGTLRKLKLDSIAASPTVVSTFRHSQEKASPGYYQVYLDDYQIDVALTATRRTGLQRYQYQKDEASEVRLNLGFSKNWDKTTGNYVKVIGDSILVGYRKSTGWAKTQSVYFVSQFSEALKQVKIYEGDKLFSDTTKSAKGKELLVAMSFEAAKTVMVKTGISAVSIENAWQNLKEEQPGFDFEKVKSKAEETWEKRLAKVKIQASHDNMVQFYTAMYHSLLAPTIFSDVNGAYRSPNGQILKTQGLRYTTFSLWDTYRALHPWHTIVNPGLVPDMCRSLTGFYKESGLLPVWNMLGNETNMMIGYHAVPVLVDAYLKGLAGTPDTLLYEAIKQSAMQDEFGVKQYKKLGYVPYEDGPWSVSRTMEYAYDDWCIAQMAKQLARQEDYRYFMRRASNYTHHFDTLSRYFVAKSIDGSFKAAFNPFAYHPEDYCEANALQYHWHAQHQIDTLITLTGGKKLAAQRLDSLFRSGQTTKKLPEWISGYIGQYVHGNEPSHHIPYLYQYVGQPHKTQQIVREVMDKMYTTQPDGICGNEDCGQMSAWYLFSALGMYPVNPVGGQYVLGSPEVKEAEISLPNGKKFTIEANGQSSKNIYVKRILLNGQPLSNIFITHQQLMKGGKLVFEMSPVPLHN